MHLESKYVGICLAHSLCIGSHVSLDDPALEHGLILADLNGLVTLEDLIAGSSVHDLVTTKSDIFISQGASLLATKR